MHSLFSWWGEEESKVLWALTCQYKLILLWKNKERKKWKFTWFSSFGRDIWFAFMIDISYREKLTFSLVIGSLRNLFCIPWMGTTCWVVSIWLFLNVTQSITGSPKLEVWPYNGALVGRWDLHGCSLCFVDCQVRISWWSKPSYLERLMVFLMSCYWRLSPLLFISLLQACIEGNEGSFIAMYESNPCCIYIFINRKW